VTPHDDQEHAAQAIVAGPQSEAAVAPDAPTSQAYAVDLPTILSDEQRRFLVAVLDRIVPPHGALPGAGTLGVDAAIDRTLAQTPRLRRTFLNGLAEIGVAAARETGQEFLALDATRQEAVLRVVEQAEPAFFAALVEHTYRGYYVHPEVHAAIGYATRPPQPLGHELAPWREELLQLQVNRAPFWRRAEPSSPE
jgi:hypothetical protein